VTTWLKHCQVEQVPFDLREADLQSAADGFLRKWGSLIVRPLVGLAPYAALTEALSEHGLVGGPLEVWAALDRRGRKALLDNLGTPGAASAGVRAAEQVKKEWGDAFQVVFQKGFYQALIQMADSHKQYLTAWGLSVEDDSLTAFVEAWISRFNRLIAPRLKGSSDFWLGAGRTVLETIDYSNRGMNALSGLVTLALSAPVDAWLANRTDRVQIERSARGYLKDVLEKTKVTGPKAGIDGPLTRRLKLYRDSVDRLLVSSALADGKDLSEEQLAKRRLEWMVSRLADTLLPLVD